MKQKVTVFWFRRDLRLHDNVGLYHALRSGHPVLPIFIFDRNILSKLSYNDPRVGFIHKQLQKMRSELAKNFKSSIAVFYGRPLNVFHDLISQYEIKTVFANHDYEPYAIQRDSEVQKLLDRHSIDFKTFKDQVVFERNEIRKDDGTPYVVYTPYKNRWKETFDSSIHLVDFDTRSHFGKLLPDAQLPNLSLKDIGFAPPKIKVPDFVITPTLINKYEATRNFPARKNGTSRLGPHLRFGTVSVRKIMKRAITENNEVFWNELIWREFFMQIIWGFPHTVNKAFKPKYDQIAWRNNKNEFELWKTGQTGYAMVDAGMRELNATGYMHNRVRMLAASFLCKHLLIDWRWGEAYFAEKLLDYEQASNVGNWQWAAGSGVDAAPYFRIFNPMTQVDKFDKQKEYINKWVPDFQELTYSQKMVDHKMARERCLKAYKAALD